MSVWRALIAALLCGFLTYPALAEELPDGTGTYVEAEEVVFSMGVLIDLLPLVAGYPELDDLIRANSPGMAKSSDEMDDRTINRMHGSYRRLPLGYLVEMRGLVEQIFVERFEGVALEAGEHSGIADWLALFDQELERAKIRQAAIDALGTGDYERAWKVVFPLALAGSPVEQMTLASYYMFGRGVPVDECLAVIWTDKAARAGYWPAQERLGLAYALGTGVRKDMDLAYLWRLAAEGNGGSEVTIAENPNGQPVITEARLAELREMSESWSPQAQPPADIVFAPRMLYDDPGEVEEIEKLGISYCDFIELPERGDAH